MNKMKKIIIMCMGILIVGGSGCEISNRESMSENETASESEDSNVIIKDDSEVKEIVNEYLIEKYEKEFKISMTDRLSRIYNSYLLTAYDENFESISVTISFTDENNYTISDDGLMLKIAGDLEIWLKELVDPYIESEFKNHAIERILDAFGIQRSLSEKGTPYDNAVAESMYNIIKTEFVFGQEFADLDEFKLLWFDYVNWYNNVRIHGSLD